MNYRENGQESPWLQQAFEQFEGPLVSYATRLIGDADRGRDVVQDVFLRLCREGPEQKQDHLAAWLYTVCRNRALDICRKERRMTSLPESIHDSMATNLANPSTAAEQKEEAVRARSMLDGLPENQQEVIRLKIEHGLKYREISEITGLSVSNVGYLLHHGLKTLQHRMNQSII